MDLDAVAQARISAPAAEQLGLYPDWPTWPLGVALTGTWEWLLEQVEAGAMPDLPCRWSKSVTPGRSAVYWLDTEARTRHVVVGYGDLLLTSATGANDPRSRMN